jgi:hypothetical protein
MQRHLFLCPNLVEAFVQSALNGCKINTKHSAHDALNKQQCASKLVLLYTKNHQLVPRV